MPNYLKPVFERGGKCILLLSLLVFLKRTMMNASSLLPDKHDNNRYTILENNCVLPSKNS